MNNYKLINCAQPLTLSQIHSVEEKLNIHFPSSLIELYLSYNGGIIEGDRNIYIAPGENDYYIKYFLPIDNKSKFPYIDFESVYNEYIIEKRIIPVDFIPFALDGGGWPFCINTLNSKIYIANLENFEENESLPIIMEEIAPSIKIFINDSTTEEEAYGY